MHPNGKWFHERALLEADIIWQLVAEVGGMHIVPDDCPHLYDAQKQRIGFTLQGCRGQEGLRRTACQGTGCKPGVELRCLLSLCHSVASLLPLSCNSRSLHRVLLAL